MENTITLANIYLKDGSKKHVTIVGGIDKKIQFISNTNIDSFMQTGLNNYIEIIDTDQIEAIDTALK